MAGWHLALLSIIGLIVLSHGSPGTNPFQIMNNVMRRMKAEFEHASSGAQKSRQVFKFKQHLNHIVRVHLVVQRGMPPPPGVAAKLDALMKSQLAEMETHMKELLNSVGTAFGHHKVHLLVKKVREHCNRHIVNRRKKMMEKLREKPKKKFIAFRGQWKESEAKYECHKRGGHLAMIASEEERFKALQAMGKTKLNFYVNPIHPHGRHGMWLMPSLRPWFQRPKSFRCAMLDSKKGGIMSVDCETKQGALCEFLSFNPYLRHAGKRVFFPLSGAGTFAEGSRRCKRHGGKMATIQDREDLESAQRVNNNAPAFFTLASHILNSKSSFCKSGNVSKEPYRFALKNGICYRVKNHQLLTPLCETRVLMDRISKSTHPTAIGKVFIAFNKKTDLYSKTEATSKCNSIGGSIARIRNNPQQLAALAALHHGLSVRFDNLVGKTDKWFWWSDGTRLPKTQEWRVDGFNMNQGVSLNKFGEWHPAIGKMGVLCEVIRESGENDNGFGFKTEIRMDIDFDQVTVTAESEKIFTRALEEEVWKQCKGHGKGVKDVIVISLRPGSTIAKIRVWTHSDGREEASALQNSLDTGKFSVRFMGRKISPTPHQILGIDFDVTICIFRVPVPTKLIYCIIPGAIALLALTLIVAMVSLMRRKKRQARVNSVFTVDKEKELMAQEEEKGPLPTCDAPPPYPASDDTPPDYDSCLNSKDLKI